MHSQMQYYSAVKNELFIFQTTWMNLKGTMPSERRQSQVYILYDSIYMTFFKKQNYSDRNQISIC